MYHKLSEIECNQSQLDVLRYHGLPDTVTRLVDVIDWLQLNKNIFISVDVNNFYHIGRDMQIHVAADKIDIHKITYERYERCLMEGLDMAIKHVLEYTDDPMDRYGDGCLE